MYLSWFFHNLAFNPAAITQTDINEYVTHYSAPGGMRAGFEYYRAFPQDAIQNMNYSMAKLTMRVLTLGGGYPNTVSENVMKTLAQNVTGIIVPNSGHYIPEEQPDFVINALYNFFGGGGNSTSTGK